MHESRPSKIYLNFSIFNDIAFQIPDVAISIQHLPWVHDAPPYNFRTSPDLSISSKIAISDSKFQKTISITLEDLQLYALSTAHLHRARAGPQAYKTKLRIKLYRTRGLNPVADQSVELPLLPPVEYWTATPWWKPHRSFDHAQDGELVEPLCARLKRPG